jgi:hypothetical protein
MLARAQALLRELERQIPSKAWLLERPSQAQSIAQPVSGVAVAFPRA